MADNIYINYGCGWDIVSDWKNFDASPTLQFERLPILGRLYTKNKSRFPESVYYGDIVRGLPVQDGVVTGIYCSHVLEHLSLEDFRMALKNTYNLLHQDGTFRMVLPDLEFEISTYCNSNRTDRSLEFIKNIGMGVESRQKGLMAALSSLFGNSRHLWAWDFNGIKSELEEIGFKNIRRAYYGDSIDSNFNLAESKDRWINALGVECKKS